MSHKTNRRNFLKGTAAAGVGYWAAGGVALAQSDSPNERLQFACCGIGGKGSSDSADAAKNGGVVAACDIDAKRLEGAGKRFKGAKLYYDYRKMLEENEDKIDAVTVSTPDHCHAVVTAMAIKMGKHCFVQKPLTHSIYEARVLGELTAKHKVATQMGNQGTANAGLRKAAALIKAGALGTVKEVHVWSNRPIWPQGGDRPAEEPVPDHVHWNEFLGPAPLRPYGKGYHPFSWRGWWDFGTGALGDMACHTVNMPYAGLDMRDPTSVVAETSGHNEDSYPKWSIIDFEFPANDWRPGFKFRWQDGGKRPDKELLGGRNVPGSGCLIIGDKGKMFSPDDYASNYELFDGAEEKDVEFTSSPGHFAEWIRAIRGGEPAMSNFKDYAGPLTETILLGNLAVWAAAKGKGKKVDWDAKKMVAKGSPEVDHIIRPKYREGYSL